jgi:hypothetical protein
MPKDELLRIAAELKQLGDSPQKKNKNEVEIQCKWRELRAAKEKESNRIDLNHVDYRVLVEELHMEGDDKEEALLPKSIEELVAELGRRRSRNNGTN